MGNSSDSGSWSDVSLQYNLQFNYQDPPCTLNLGYMVPNSAYLGVYRG